MEDRVLTKKQYQTFKFIRGWLMALFVLSIIGGIGFLISYIFSFFFASIDVMQNPQITASSLTLIPVVVASIMLGTLLFHKGPKRKNDVSSTMLVYAVCNVALGVFNLAVTSSFSAASIGNSFAIVYLAIFLFFAIVLFLKTRQKQLRAFPIQMLFMILFILYIIILFVSQFMIASQFDFSPGMVRYSGYDIAFNIVVGFSAFMYLIPMISLFKALDDEVFYEHFIARHPSVAINRYEKTACRPAIKPQAAGYCVNCGNPLLPGAVYCSRCGHKVGERIIKKEN